MYFKLILESHQPVPTVPNSFMRSDLSLDPPTMVIQSVLKYYAIGSNISELMHISILISKPRNLEF